MYPQQNGQPPIQPPQTQYPIDYLNQIAPQEKRPGLDNRKFFIFIGAGLLVAIIIGVLALFNGGTTPTQKMETLSARLTTLQTISSKAQANIKSSSLRSANSSLTLLLTNTNHDIIDPFKTNGVNVQKLDKTIVKQEDGKALSAKLEDARLNAVFDRTYAREMSYQLDTVKALMKDIYGKTKSKSLKSFLETANNNLSPINKQLQDFNAANG